MEIKRYEGKIAVVTGAGNGIGACMVERLLQEGAKVAAVDIESGALQARYGNRADVVFCATCDVSDSEAVNKTVQKIVEHFGRIDLLINNAGIMMGGSVLDLPGKDWEWTFQVNCMSQVYAMKRVIPIMKKQGTPAHIVNVASVAGLVPSHQMPAYTATKNFCVGLTESVCLEL